MDKLMQKFGITKKADEIVFCEYEPGNTVFFLMKGSIRLSKITKDREKMLAILEPGAIFGEMSLLDNKPRSATCIAHTDSELLEFDKENFEILIKAKPSLGIQLLYTFVKRITDQERKLRILKHQSDESKIIDTIIMLLEDKGSGEDLWYVPLKESQEAIAKWAGIELSRCQEIINKLKNHDRIEVNDEGIVIKHVENLRSMIAKEQVDIDSNS